MMAAVHLTDCRTPLYKNISQKKDLELAPKWLWHQLPMCCVYARVL